ncbi:MAG: 2-C-methyl-D-erythritol 4-phosphate cytidylyltransferase, partial [Coprobacillus sp.]|nr:2-C-methyl-D-erythritol 4-phosphate cytidylyltransferase [Coprobacillus sp.]
DEYKQFILVEGKPLFMYAYETLIGHPAIDEIVVVTLKGAEQKVKEIIDEYDSKKPHHIVTGGSTRSESTYNGLCYIKAANNDKHVVVLIHDGDRPLVSERIISENIEKVTKTSPVCTILPIYDAVINFKNKKNKKGKYLDKEKTFLVQTPQTFMNINNLLKYIKNAIKKGNKFPDETSVIRKQKVNYVNGDQINFKITKKCDILLLKSLLNNKYSN